MSIVSARRRLRRLEAELTDSSGLIPHSAAWIDYWMKEVDKAVTERGSGPKRAIPLEAIHAWMQAQPDTDWKYDNEP
jgi:hypothetical protein